MMSNSENDFEIEHDMTLLEQMQLTTKLISLILLYLSELQLPLLKRPLMQVHMPMS
jgi:hypothetical protein